MQRAAKPSNCGPNISVQAPFNKEVSEAITEVRTLGPLSLLSKNPIFFYKILEYNSFLIVYVTFSPKNVPDFLWRNVPTELLIAIKTMYIARWDISFLT